MYQTNKEHIQLSSETDVLVISRIPISLWVTFVYAGAMVMQYLNKPLLIQSIVFTLFITLHNVLSWYSNNFTKERNWIYFFVQGGLVFGGAFLLPEGSPVILLGLLPILISQSITKFGNRLKVFLIFIIFYALYCFAIGIIYGLEGLPIFIPILFLIMTIVIFYSVIYNRQVNARLRMEYYLKELESAHRKVEELTLVNERQRMARDLHDTLAQGVAGLIMQLEAVDSHLEKGNIDRSREIIQKSMERARATLSDARKAIDNLRIKTVEEINFYYEALEQIKRFKDETTINVNYHIEPTLQVSSLITEHSLYIISECLTNIAKHSQAENVIINIIEINNQLRIEIEDNGIGFDFHLLGKHKGKYGLLGLKERARIIGGKINIQSDFQMGTKIIIDVPIS
jgi:two-component system, NarL family, sensor histidine kinase YdfH